MLVEKTINQKLEGMKMAVQIDKSAKIEDIAANYFDSSQMKNLLEFIEFLKSNKLTPK